MILFFTNTIVGGGAEKQLLLTARGLAARGYACRIFSLTKPTDHPRYNPILRECADVGVTIVYPSNFLGRAWVVSELVKIVLSLDEVVLWTWGFRAEAIRVLCPYLWKATGVLALRSASDEEALRQSWLIQVGSSLTARYIANSRKGITVLARANPSILEKSRIIYNTVELVDNPPFTSVLKRAGVVTIVMLGNNRYLAKGYDIAIRVGALAKIRELPIRIVIGGRHVVGEPELSEQIKKAGVGSHVEWVGQVNDVRAHLKRADVFMLLSRYEGLPNALLEAMAAGLACIATDVGDLREFADGGAGLEIVPIDDPEAAVQCIERLVRNPNLIVAAGLRARRFCEKRFSYDAMIRTTIQELNSLVPRVCPSGSHALCV